MTRPEILACDTGRARRSAGALLHVHGWFDSMSLNNWLSMQRHSIHEKKKKEKIYRYLQDIYK